MLPPGVDLYLRASLRRASVVGAAPAALSWLHTFLTFNPPDPRTPEPVYLLQPDGFPVGLLELVRSAALREGIAVEVHDTREPPCPWSPGDLPDDLRDYQRDAVSAALRAGRGILKLGTGAGKGNIITAIPRVARTTWVVGVHREHLLHDLAQRFEEATGERAGRVMSGRADVRRVTFATLQTLYASRRKHLVRELFRDTYGLIVDEAHTVSADTFATVVEAFDAAYWKIGLSATPFARSDARGVFNAALLGPMLLDISAGELVDQGTLARPEIEMVRFQHDPAVVGLSWHDLYRTEIAENEARNRLCLLAAMRLPRPVMLFVTQIEHGRALDRTLTAEGVRSRVVNGGSKGWQRLRVIDDLNHGRLDVAVANSVFNEGVNVEGLRSVVIAAGGASAIATLQRVGRATRRTTGKTTCNVFDIYDEGLPALERHSAERRIAYVREGYNVTTKDFPDFPALGGPRLPGF